MLLLSISWLFPVYVLSINFLKICKICKAFSRKRNLLVPPFFFLTSIYLCLCHQYWRIKCWSFRKSCGMFQFGVIELFLPFNGEEETLKIGLCQFPYSVSVFLCEGTSINKISFLPDCTSIVLNIGISLYFWAFKKIRKFSWISILLFSLASDLPHWFVLFHSSMITALVTFRGGSWKVRIRRKHNKKGREKKTHTQNLHLARSGS